MTTFKPTSKQLQDALGHVYYEIDQLLYANSISTNEAGINNALLESSLVHLRALLDFFEHSSRTKQNGTDLDDVLSIDYGFSSQAVPIEKIYRDRLNKDLAHITYSRTERLPSEKYWPLAQIYPPILERVENFIEHLIQKILPSKKPSEIPVWQTLKERVIARRVLFASPSNLTQTTTHTLDRN